MPESPLERWSIHPVSAFEQYRASWDFLNQSGPNSPLLTSEFFRLLIKYFATGRELLAVCGDPARPTAMAIVQSQSHFSWETFQPSQAPLGAWVQRSGIEIEQLARSLVHALPGRALLVGVTQVDPDLFARPATSSMVETSDYIETARVSINGTFDEYWAKRGKNLRHNLKRQRNQLANNNIECRMEVISAPDQVASAIAIYGQLESAGWKAEFGTAVAPDNAQGRFYTELLQSCCAEQRGRIYQLWSEGRVIATDLCIDNGGTAVILKTTYDENVNTISAALLLREEYFRHLFAAGLARIEFYGKVMDWHRKWTDEIRTMYHLNSYRSPAIVSLRRRFAPAAGILRGMLQSRSAKNA